MKILLSWSGKRSQELARILHGWLPNVIQAIRPWMSDLDMEMGINWSRELSDQLESTKFGIICLTKDNLDSKWVLFEAGALSKSKDTRVCPYLLDIKPTDLLGPLGQFQCAMATKNDTEKLVISINQALGKDSLSEAQLHKAFENNWSELEKEIKKISKNVHRKTASPLQNNDKIDEIISTLRILVKMLSEFFLYINLNNNLSSRVNSEEKLSFHSPNILWNMEEIDTFLIGKNGSIKQDGEDYKIGSWKIYRYKQANGEILQKGRALIHEKNEFKVGPAIGYFETEKNIEKYNIFIDKTALCDKETNAVFFQLRDKI